PRPPPAGTSRSSRNADRSTTTSARSSASATGGRSSVPTRFEALMEEPRERLLALVRGYRISQSIYVATRLGIPDLLADGPREVDELAQATRSHPKNLRRVLLFLAGVGVLDTVGPRRFALTELAAPLRTD